MRVVAMFRVSTEKQANEGASLDAQEHGYRGLADRHEWETVAVFRGSESATQASRERAVLQQVLACIRERRPEAIYVHEQSRLTRGDELEVAALLRELREQEIKIIIGGVVRDLSSLDERFMVGIQSLVDRAEAERIKERHLRGKRAKARRGLKNSGPTPFGYRNPPPGHPDRGQLQIVEDEAVIVRRVFAMAGDGDAVRAIAARLNAEGVPSPRGKHWGKSSIARMLANPAYRGCHVTGGWVAEPGSRTFRFDQDQPGAIVVEGSHQPIVSPAGWQAAQPDRPAPPTPKPRMLSGLMTMNGHPATGDSSHKTSFYRPPRGTHGGPWIPVETADSVVWGAFVRAVSEPSFLERVVTEVRDRQKQELVLQEGPSLAARVEKLEARLARLVDMRADGDINGEEFRKRSSEARDQVRAARQRLALVKQLEIRGDGQWVRKAFAAVRLLVVAERALSSDERRRVLHRAVQNVSVKARRDPEKQAKDERGRYRGVKKSPWQIETVTFDLALGVSAGDGVLDTTC